MTDRLEEAANLYDHSARPSMPDYSQLDKAALKGVLFNHVHEACAVMKEIYSRHCQETGKVDVQTFERDHPELL
jgi:hypothetical protein